MKDHASALGSQCFIVSLGAVERAMLKYRKKIFSPSATTTLYANVSPQGMLFVLWPPSPGIFTRSPGSGTPDTGMGGGRRYYVVCLRRLIESDLGTHYDQVSNSSHHLMVSADLNFPGKSRQKGHKEYPRGGRVLSSESYSPSRALDSCSSPSFTSLAMTLTTTSSSVLAT